MTAPNAADTERFRRDADLAYGRSVAGDDRVAIAVSGGPDSMALLALARGAWPGRVIAATVDHGLRAEAADEANMVAAYCAVGEIPHTVLTPPSPIGATNVQANARVARYALLTAWAETGGATILATAHHADDQAETFLMRAARGSGLAGLAGIRPRQRLGVGLTLIRPLLRWRRSELRGIATGLRLPFVDDPSNADRHYDRTHVRALLAEAPLLDAVRIARSAAWLAEADADLRALEQWLLANRAEPAPPGERSINVAGLPREVCRRIVRACIDVVRDDARITRPDWSAAANVEPLLDALMAGKRATQAGVMATAKGEIWHFRAAPPRKSG